MRRGNAERLERWESKARTRFPSRSRWWCGVDRSQRPTDDDVHVGLGGIVQGWCRDGWSGERSGIEGKWE